MCFTDQWLVFVGVVSDFISTKIFLSDMIFQVVTILMLGFTNVYINNNRGEKITTTNDSGKLCFID